MKTFIQWVLSKVMPVKKVRYVDYLEHDEETFMDKFDWFVTVTVAAVAFFLLGWVGIRCVFMWLGWM